MHTGYRFSSEPPLTFGRIPGSGETGFRERIADVIDMSACSVFTGIGSILGDLACESNAEFCSIPWQPVVSNGHSSSTLLEFRVPRRYKLGVGTGSSDHEVR